MGFLDTIIELLHTNCIRALFVSVLLLLPFKYFLKNKVDIYYASQIIRWFILCYASFLFIRLFLMLVFPFGSESTFAFVHRAFGPYWWSYWTMFVLHTFLPFLLLIKKFGQKIYFLLFISLLMNIGWLLESFVIHMTSMHRDFRTDDLNPFLPFDHEQVLLLKGLCLGALILAAGNILKTKNKNRTYIESHE